MAQPSKNIRLNTDTNLLKIIAIITMVIDHAGKMFFPQYPIFRIIGRLAFPIFAYCLTVGCLYTRSMPKYLLRIALLALISQPFYVLGLGHTQAVSAFNADNNFVAECVRWYLYTWRKPSIMASLFAGLTLLWTFRAKNYVASALVVALIWVFQGYLDYGLNGIILMALFYALCDHPLASLTWVAGYMLFWGLSWSRVSLGNLMGSQIGITTQFYAVLALPFIYVPTKTNIRMNKYIFYVFYPAHLLAIYLIGQLM